jgi:hypothetical protein
MPAYEPTEPPPEDTDFGPSHDEITAELLTLTHNFFRQASPATREELRQFLTGQGHHPITGLEAFLDTMQFNAGHHRPAT